MNFRPPVSHHLCRERTVNSGSRLSPIARLRAFAKSKHPRPHGSQSRWLTGPSRTITVASPHRVLFFERQLDLRDARCQGLRPLDGVQVLMLLGKFEATFRIRDTSGLSVVPAASFRLLHPADVLSCRPCAAWWRTAQAGAISLKTAGRPRCDGRVHSLEQRSTFSPRPETGRAARLAHAHLKRRSPADLQWNQ